MAILSQRSLIVKNFICLLLRTIRFRIIDKSQASFPYLHIRMVYLMKFKITVFTVTLITSTHYVT